MWLHVITDGSTGLVSKEAIQQQLWALNAGFGGLEGGAATGFQFKLAGVTYTDDAAWFNAKIGTNGERAFKQALRRGGAETLNVYTNAGGGALGYAYYPGDYRERLRRRCRPRLQHAPRRRLRRPVLLGEDAHARGRSLAQPRAHVRHGLLQLRRPRGRHPGAEEPDERFPIGRDSCVNHLGLDRSTTTGLPFDSCYFEFTPGQATRMQDAWLFFRAGT